jgi:hypothetical protein
LNTFENVHVMSHHVISRMRLLATVFPFLFKAF